MSKRLRTNKPNGAEVVEMESLAPVIPASPGVVGDEKVARNGANATRPRSASASSTTSSNGVLAIGKGKGA
jgi:hypothetical protein